MNSILLCRCCLVGNSKKFDIFSKKLTQQNVKEKMEKYLNLELKEFDSVPNIICEKCLEVVDNFHTFYEQVHENQSVLQTVAIQTQNNTVINVTTATEDVEEEEEEEEEVIKDIESNSDDYIKIEVADFSVQQQPQLPQSSPRINPVNESIVIETVAQPENILDVNNVILIEKKVLKRATKKKTKSSVKRTPTKMKSTKSTLLETAQESVVDIDLTNYEYEYEITFDDSDEDEVSDDEDHLIENQVEADIKSNVDFSEFPKKIIDDCKLLIKGKELMSLMSKFYRIECEMCTGKSQQFDSITALCRHYTDRHAIKGFVTCCGTKLVKPRAMAMHMARHIQPEAFRCNVCNKMMTCPKILQYHIQNHLPEEKRPLGCPACPRRFSYSSALIAHSISHQAESERPAHICDECGKTFSSPGRLSTHINVVHTKHNNSFFCHICARQFSCRGNLVYHITTHQPRMHQVQCEQCGKWLKNKLCLRKHMAQHSSVRFTCNLCPYTAVNRQCLRNHAKVQHTDIKPFNCEVCGKNFKLKTTLVNHMVQHTGLRKFSCQFCSRTFASSGNYYSHRKRMHPQELANFKQLQEAEEQVLREKALQKKV